MSWIAVALLSVSALAHAYWNLRGKSRQPSAALFLVGDGTVALLLLPLLLLSLPVLARLPARFWAFAAATGFCEALYYTGLACAYRTGHLSVIYPVVRSLPVVLVAAASVLLGRSQHIGSASLAGMGGIVAGCLLLPWPQRGGWRALGPWRVGHLWAALAGVGSAGYMLIDDSALALLRAAAGGPGASALAALRFAPLITLSTTVWLAGYVASRRAERQALAALWRSGLGYAQATGLTVWLAYGLVLVAMGYSRDVSYVTAFRQISIPIGAAFGVLLLREPLTWPKAIGVGLVFVGVVVVALG
jgi:uncharacterized membrane protein